MSARDETSVDGSHSVPEDQSLRPEKSVVAESPSKKLVGDSRGSRAPQRSRKSVQELCEQY